MTPTATVPTYRHASLSTDGECYACVEEQAMFEAGYPICANADASDDDDPELRLLCGWCGHTVEEVPAPIAA